MWFDVVSVGKSCESETATSRPRRLPRDESFEHNRADGTPAEAAHRKTPPVPDAGRWRGETPILKKKYRRNKYPPVRFQPPRFLSQMTARGEPQPTHPAAKPCFHATGEGHTDRSNQNKSRSNVRKKKSRRSHRFPANKRGRGRVPGYRRPAGLPSNATAKRNNHLNRLDCI